MNKEGNEQIQIIQIMFIEEISEVCDEIFNQIILF